MKKENTFVWWFVVVFLFVAVFVIFKTENSFGGSDTISHYKIAHWAWKYPHLLLDSWGKPVFTLLISPWAQFGMNGARVYNVIIGLCTALLLWRLSFYLSIQHKWLGLFLVVFVPIYFISMFTSLTEVTFSFILILSVFLFYKDKMVWSAVVLSFLPFVRTEGAILFVLFIGAFALRKRYLAIPFLLTGFLVYSVAGWGYYHDFWWIVNQNPYSGNAVDIYGHGSLLHFIDKMPVILGYPVVILFLIGLIVIIVHWIKSDKWRLSKSVYFLLLVPGSFLLYLAAHSFVWWRGMGNSLGLIRVMAAVAPAASLTALVGMDWLLKSVQKFSRVLKLTVLSVFLIWIIMVGISTYLSAFSVSPTEKLLSETAIFIKHKQLDNNKIYYFDPYLAYKLGADPYSNQIIQWYPKGNNPVAKLPGGCIVVWDAHFGPNEGREPLNDLLKNDAMGVVKIFRPKYPFKVLGGYDYSIYVFQKK